MAVALTGVTAYEAIATNSIILGLASGVLSIDAFLGSAIFFNRNRNQVMRFLHLQDSKIKIYDGSSVRGMPLVLPKNDADSDSGNDKSLL